MFAVWRWPRWTLVALVLVPLSYPLSVGLAVALYRRGYLPQSSLRVLQIVYGPLESSSRVPVLGIPIKWYVQWWTPPPQPQPPVKALPPTSIQPAGNTR